MYSSFRFLCLLSSHSGIPFLVLPGCHAQTDKWVKQLKSTAFCFIFGNHIRNLQPGNVANKFVMTKLRLRVRHMQMQIANETNTSNTKIQPWEQPARVQSRSNNNSNMKTASVAKWWHTFITICSAPEKKTQFNEESMLLCPFWCNQKWRIKRFN